MPADNPIHDLALAAIDADTQIKELLVAGDDGQQMPFSMLYAYVNDPTFVPPADFESLLMADVTAQANLELLLEKASLAHMPMLAAASSGDATRRETDAAIMTLTPSRAEPEQMYLKIVMKDSSAVLPTQLFVRRTGETWIRKTLPEFTNATAQLLLEASSPIGQALRAPDGEAYLR